MTDTKTATSYWPSLLPTHYIQELHNMACNIPHLTLTVNHDDIRKNIRAAQAGLVIYKWKQQVQNAPADAIVQKVVLASHVYSRVAIVMITSYLKPIVSRTTAVDLSGIVTDENNTEEAVSGLKALCNVFRQCQLVEVNLSANQIPPNANSQMTDICQVGASVLEAQRHTLKHLFLKNMNWNLDTMNRVANLLTIPKTETCICDNLQTLHLHHELHHDGGAEFFKRILVASKQLANIRFTGCRAFTDGSNALGDGFDKMKSIDKLQKLSLSNSHFGNGNGISLFAKAMANCTKLTHLHLANCGLGIKGTEQVCAALCQAKVKLVELNLSQHKLGPSGVLPVVKLLKTTVHTLKVFRFKDNQLTSLGIIHIMKGLTWNQPSPLEQLDLSCNECGHLGANALLPASFPNLTFVDLNHNAFSWDDLQRLDSKFGSTLQELNGNNDVRDVDKEYKLENEKHQDGLDGLISNISQVIGLVLEPCGVTM